MASVPDRQFVLLVYKDGQLTWRERGEYSELSRLYLRLVEAATGFAPSIPDGPSNARFDHGNVRMTLVRAGDTEPGA